MKNIVKAYPGVIANNNVNFILNKGEIHGLVGENGAGKSTLMNLLYGMQSPDSGKIEVNGNLVKLYSSRDAIKKGIGMVHQHFMLVPSLTVLQNIIIGNAPQKGIFIDILTAKKKIMNILEEYSFTLDLDAKIYQLSIGQRQRVEIIKALYRGADILILDEPTAVLTPQEVLDLIDILQKLKKQGRSIIIITHKLKEVLQSTDRITVMRKGKVTGVVNTKDTDEKELANLMVGRDVNLQIEKTKLDLTSKVFEVNNLHVIDQRGREAVKNVSFSIMNGEILGICGVEGNGQTEIVNAITGLMPQSSGEIKINGNNIEKMSVRDRRECGMSHIPEDRLKVGCAANCTVKENLILNKYYMKPFLKYGVIDKTRTDEFSIKMINRFNIKVPTVEYELSTLSGGNMQKVILARELELEPEILVAAQPTRGVDIGAIESIRKELVILRDKGKAILLVSSELEEIMSLSDRIAVVYEGEIVGYFRPEETTEEELGLYMAGAGPGRSERNMI
jgi:simple sugar transport system ATP-binding protein